MYTTAGGTVVRGEYPAERCTEKDRMACGPGTVVQESYSTATCIKQYHRLLGCFQIRGSFPKCSTFVSDAFLSTDFNLHSMAFTTSTYVVDP